MGKTAVKNCQRDAPLLFFYFFCVFSKENDLFFNDDKFEGRNRNSRLNWIQRGEGEPLTICMPILLSKTLEKRNITCKNKLQVLADKKHRAVCKVKSCGIQDGLMFSFICYIIDGDKTFFMFNEEHGSGCCLLREPLFHTLTSPTCLIDVAVYRLEGQALDESCDCM